MASRAGSASSSPASGYRAPGVNTGSAPSPSSPHRASARSPSRGTGSGSTGTAAPGRWSSSPATRLALPAAAPAAAPRPRAATRPSALRTLNVDTPVAAAISLRVAPAASSSPIRAASSGVSFEAPFGPRRAGTSPASPPAASA